MAEFGQFDDALNALLERRFNTGVYSLSTTLQSELLWAHYAEAHKGYCIEYDSEKILNNFSSDGQRLYVIDYHQSPSKIGLLDILTPEGHEGLIRKMLCSKSRAWAYEEEVRILIERPGRVSHHPQAISAIHFGIRMEDEHKELIHRKLKGRGIQFRQMEFISDAYDMESFEYRSCSTEGALPGTNSEGGDEAFDRPSFVIRAIRPMVHYGRAEIDIDLLRGEDVEEAQSIALALSNSVFSTAKRHVVNFYVPNQKDSRSPRAVADCKEGSIHVVTNAWT